MRILITGAGGFIGSHVVEATVRAGHQVRCIVNYNSRSDFGYVAALPDDIRAELDVRVADIRDSEAVYACGEKVDAIFHLAALIGIPYSYVAPMSYVQVNVQGTMNLLNMCRRFGVKRFVHTSTSEVYGSAEYTPIDERHPLVGQSPYSASKIAADKVAESYALSFDLPVTILRPFNTFGPRQSLRAIIPTLASQLLDKNVLMVQAGSLHTVRDYTYVTDTADAYLKSLDCNVSLGKAINLGTGVGFSIAEIYEKLQNLSGIRKPIETDRQRVRPENSEVQRLISNNELARKLLRWKPQVSFESGLSAVVEDISQRGITRSTAYYT